MGGVNLGVKPPANEQGADWKRADGSQKGHGFLGLYDRGDGTGKKSSELSMGFQVDELNGGKQTDIPLMVSTLNDAERDYLLNVPVEKHEQADPKMFQGIVHKAIGHAIQREKQGKPVFAEPNESPKPKPRLLEPKPVVRDLEAIESGLIQAENK
jgi:hypothetical protein